MNTINHLKSIPGVTNVEEIESPAGRQDRQYKVTMDIDQYDDNEKTVVYTQANKKISFRTRTTIGKLIGYNRVQAFAFAVFTIFKSQERITDYYVKKFKNANFFKTVKKFYAKKQINLYQLDKKIFMAFYVNSRAFQGDVDGTLTRVNAILLKIKSNINSITYNSQSHQMQLKKERHVLQELARFKMRNGPYSSLGRGDFKKEYIISEDALSIFDEPIFKEMKKIQRTVFTHLGFEKKP